MKERSSLTWEEYNQKTVSERAKYLKNGDRLYDILFSQQYSKEFLDEMYRLTNKIRLISKTVQGEKFLKSLLETKKALLYFVQPSTRTYLSFISACQTLGIRVSDVRSSETSSEIKGESSEDSIRTFSSYFDLIIMRHPEEGFAEKAAFVLNSDSRRPIPLINAGSGKDQHPTQALLDIFTLQKSFQKFGGIDGKTVMFSGDLKRGRTCRSLVYLLTNYKDVRFIFSSPKKFEMEEDIKVFLRERKSNFLETTDFKKYLKEADALYMTRIQSEHDKYKGESNHYNIKDYTLNKESIELMKPRSFILHPLPRRQEISPEVDNDPRSIYWRQVRNGMWTRVALLSYIFKVDQKILEY